MYQYQARVLRVIDGDTLVANVDLGFKISVVVTVRLYGIDTPELRGTTRSAGQAARARLCELVDGKQVLLDSRALDKYGRTVAVLTVDDQNVNDLLVKEGHATPMAVTAQPHGRTRKHAAPMRPLVATARRRRRPRRTGAAESV